MRRDSDRWQSHRPLVALDVGRKLGVAVGMPGTIPDSYSIVLGKPSGGLAVQASKLIAALELLLSGGDPRDESVWPAQKPAMVVKEAPFSLRAFGEHGVSEETVKSAYGLHAVIAGMCVKHGVECRDANVWTVTKHFLGGTRWGGRAGRKAAIVRRCQLLGYIPKDCNDEDRADACAVWDFAAATLARAPGALRLFGEEATAA